MKQDEYIETIVVNKKMINVGLDDYGQTYFLEYINDHGEIVENCVGAFVTDYLGYAEMLFGDPKYCEFYNKGNYCQELAHTYCNNCDKCFMCVDRNSRLP